jgi:hypothetical protein
MTLSSCSLGWFIRKGGSQMKYVGVLGMMLVCLAMVAGVANAADAKEPGTVSLSWDQFKVITGWDGREIKAGEIVVPWAEVQNLLDVKVAGVVGAKVRLPWKEFKKLVEWSVAKRKDEDKTPPPSDYVVSKATYVGKLGKDVATFEATMEVDILRKKGWKRIQLLPATVGVSKATLPKDAYLNVHGSMYEMLTKETGNKMPVALSFASAVTESGGMNAVSFDRIQTGTCLLDLSIDQKDVKVVVAGGQMVSEKAEGQGKRMLFALPAGTNVRISWERKIAEVKKGPPKLFAQTQTLVAIGDGILTCREKIAYSVVHAGVRELTLDVPKGVNVLSASCSYLHDWRVEKNKLRVQLSREVMGVHYLDLVYEKPAAEKGETLDTPVVRTADTERERGVVAVVALANVEISGAPKGGASAVDSSALPPELVGLTSQPVLLAYRYTGKTFSVPLTIAKHKDVKVLVTIIDRARYTVMQTLDGRRLVRVVYDVRNNRNQFLRVAMPKSTEIWSVTVSGRAARPAVDDKKMTLIPLIRSTGQHLTAFPVEIVYIDQQFNATQVKPPADGKGVIRVDLPKCNEPIMNSMCELYLPKRGSYSDFSSPLQKVKSFRQLRAEVVTPRGNVRAVRPAQQAAALQRMVDKQLRRSAPAGVTPIKVTLPTTGSIYLFQKVLVLGEDLYVEMKYKKWPGYSWSLF